MKTLNELFTELIFENEVSSNANFIYRFSDPDGVRSGKSGWSYGVCQFDTQNNSSALACLSECGFTHDEIDNIVKQTVDVKPFASRLKANAEIIKKYDEAQLTYCINKALNWNASHNIPITDTGAILAAADYVNQYGSQGEGFANYLEALGRPVKAQDILDFKLTHTKFGKEHPEDCKRRYNNLVAILEKENICHL